jgi:fructokinase
VLSTGFIALDILLADGGMGHAPGGTAANVAANLAFLGWRACLAGIIANDVAGRHVAKELARFGVDVSHLVLADRGETPIVVQEIAEGAHRFRFGCPECGRRFARHRPIPASDLRTFIARSSPEVYFFDRASSSTVALAEHYRETGSLIVFEPSTLGHRQLFLRAVGSAHIVKYSHQRLVAFGGVLPDVSAGQIQIETRGATGARYRLGRTSWVHLPGYDAEVVDTAGAGDWTTAGLLFTLASLKPSDVIADREGLEEALRFGQGLGAANCGYLGARGLAVERRGVALNRVRAILSRQPPTVRRYRKFRSVPAATTSCTACLGAL